MKLVDIFNGLDVNPKNKLDEQILGFTQERLDAETKNLKELINNGNKICRVYFKHLKSMNFGVVNSHIKNYDKMLENLKETQTAYNRKWNEYYDLIEEFEKNDEIKSVSFFWGLVNKLDDLQFDMDDMHDMMSDIVTIVKRGKIEELNKKYDINEKEN